MIQTHISIPREAGKLLYNIKQENPHIIKQISKIMNKWLYKFLKNTKNNVRQNITYLSLKSIPPVRIYTHKIHNIRINSNNITYIKDNPDLFVKNPFLLDEFKNQFGLYLINHLMKIERNTKYSIIGL